MNEYNNNQESLKNVTLQHLWSSEKGPSHSCEVCNSTMHEGYSTLDFKKWICPKCYKELRDEFEWELQDWRLGRGQEKYLKGAELKYITNFKKLSETWDHEHCAFCWAKFMEADGCLREGYFTINGENWICPTCFNDFKDEFKFKVIDQD